MKLQLDTSYHNTKLKKQYDHLLKKFEQLESIRQCDQQSAEALVLENNKKAEIINKLTIELQETKQKYIHQENLNSKLNEELLMLNNQLQNQLTITDTEIIARTTKLGYFAPKK